MLSSGIPQSAINWNYLQIQQSIACRTITGCVKMSDINTLHNEGEMLPVRAETIAERFLSGSYQSHRADHKTTCSTIIIIFPRDSPVFDQ